MTDKNKGKSKDGGAATSERLERIADHLGKDVKEPKKK